MKSHVILRSCRNSFHSLILHLARPGATQPSNWESSPGALRGSCPLAPKATWAWAIFSWLSTTATPPRPHRYCHHPHHPHHCCRHHLEHLLLFWSPPQHAPTAAIPHFPFLCRPFTRVSPKSQNLAPGVAVDSVVAALGTGRRLQSGQTTGHLEAGRRTCASSCGRPWWRISLWFEVLAHDCLPRTWHTLPLLIQTPAILQSIPYPSAWPAPR